MSCVSLQVFMVNLVWAAAIQWLLDNPRHPAWWGITRLVQALGGLPE